MSTINIYNLTNNDDFEEVLGFEFETLEVLDTNSEITQRKANLINAATLESISPTTVLLYIKAENEVKQIRSSVKAIGSHQIIVGRGFTIPINCISKVELIGA